MRFSYILMGLTIFGIILFASYYFQVSRPRLGTTEWINRAVIKPRFRYQFTLHTMEKRDILPLAVILAVFGFVSFYKLGNFEAPQTFYQFSGAKNPLVVELPQETMVSKLVYYTGLYTGSYNLEYSLDGESWEPIVMEEEDKYPLVQTHADLFKWRTAEINHMFTAKFIRIEATKTPIELGELALYDEFGRLVQGAAAPQLFDEQRIIPERANYLNSMYFDEIYHGRTAYETLRNIYPYETVHPPLGKTIISLGIELFGMTPFGWRCMGTLFGVIMLAALYVLIKNMFGKTFIATCGTLLLAFDFMRFTQTRIATIDTYAVFFILLSFLFMYRYLTVSGDRPIWDGMRHLGLSGLFFGIGVACKWVVIYAGAGLFVMYILKLVTDYRYYYMDGSKGGYAERVIKTLGLTAVYFIVIPLIIYIFSYLPYGAAKGMTISNGVLWNPEYYRMIWRVQVNTLSYHSDLVATHPYSSWWYQWVANHRPILYYLDYPETGVRSAFGAFGNPLVWWGGLVAVLVMIYRSIWHKDTRALVIVIGYLAQLVPWMFVSRIVFAYHYFPSTIFLVLALAHMFDTVQERGERRGKLVIAGFAAYAGLLFVLFYPALSGQPASTSYLQNVVKWLPTWPF